MAPSKTVFRCDECGKHLSRKWDLDRHMKLHAKNKDEYMIPCPYPDCDYKALQRSNLKTHIYTHTGERPYKCPCEGCKFDTRDPGALTRHRRNIHGYLPKANTRKKTKSSTGASRTTRRQSRAMPYDISSRPSRNAEIPPQLSEGNPCAPSSGVGTGDQAQALKNNSLAFETALAQMLARADGLTIGTGPNTPDSSLPSSLPPTVSEVPVAEDMSFDWQGLFTSDRFDKQVPQRTSQSDGELDRFLANYDQYTANATLVRNANPGSNPHITIPTFMQGVPSDMGVHPLGQTVASEFYNGVASLNPVPTEPGVPTAQDMPLLQLQNFLTLGQFGGQVSQPTRQPEDELDRFLANYDKYIAKASLAHNAVSSLNPHMATPTFMQGAPTDMGIHPPGQTVAYGSYNGLTSFYPIPAAPGVPTTKDASILEPQDLLTFNQFTEQAPQPATQPEDELDRFLANYDKYIAEASSAHNPTSNSSLDMAAQAASQAFTTNTIEDSDTLLSPVFLFPPSNAQDQPYQCDRVKAHNTNHTYYGQPTTRHVGYAQHSSSREGPPASVHPQTVASKLYDDPTFPYIAPADLSAFQEMQSFFAF